MFEFISFIWLLVCALVIRRTFGLSQVLNPFVMFWIYHVVFLYIGLFYRNLYDHAVTIQPAVFVMIWSGMGACLLGAVAARIHTGEPAREATARLAQMRVDDFPERILLSRLFFVAGAALIGLYFISVGAIPLLHEEADDFRIAARMGKGTLVLLALALVKYAVYQVAGIRACEGRRLIRVVPWMLVGALLVVGIGNRAPALELLVFGFVVYYAVKGIRPSVVRLALLGVGALALMAVLGILRQGHSVSSALIVLKIIWRPFANVQNLEWVYETFPVTIPFQYGYGYIVDALVILPGYSPNFGTWFKEMAGYDFSGGSVTVTYLGEIFANFGWIGIVPICFGYGFGLTWLFYRLMRRISINNLMLLVICATTLKSIVSSGIISVLLYETMMLLAIHMLFNGCLWVVRSLRREECRGPIPARI